MGTYQPCLLPSATRVAGDPLAHAQFLPDARLPRMSVGEKRDAGAYSTTAGPCGPRRPARASSRALRPSGPHGPGVAFRHPRSAILGPVRARDPPLARGSTPQAHRGTPYSLFLRSVATHDIAAARGDGGGRGLLDLTPPTGILPGAGRCHVRCWIQTPRQGSGGSIIGTVRTTGDKRDRG